MYFNFFIASDLDNSNSIELEEFIAIVSLNDKILGKKRTATGLIV